MNAFDVLSRTESVHRNLLLEASAGTGKTFAIENIIARLLIEDPSLENKTSEPLAIDQVLALTFTKAAARDLKSRILANLHAVLAHLDEASSPPDYLAAYLQADPQNRSKARLRLEQAIRTFDQAQISTIHSFCWRMLRRYAVEAGVSFDFASKEEAGGRMAARMQQVVRDFVRTELGPERIHPVQLKLLVKHCRGDPEQLIRQLYGELQGTIFTLPASFDQLLSRFHRALQRIQEQGQFEPEKVLADFIASAPLYKGTRNKQRQIYPEMIEKVVWFAALLTGGACSRADFARLIDEGLVYLKAFDPAQLSLKKQPLPELHYPQLSALLKQELQPLVSEAANPHLLFSCVAGECQRFWQRCCREEELLGHQDLLLQMQRALQNPLFIEKIRAQFRAVLVDEFQDTDPLQWEIFKTLFCSGWKGFFQLIGDPKQSIYAFRQADIYTYLAAAEVLGSQAHATLDTNYRSTPQLVDALNRLFGAVNALFPLPKTASELIYRPVRAGLKPALHIGASLQFWTVKSTMPKQKFHEGLRQWEEERFLPAIASEILDLKQKQQAAFQHIAILVADKHQALQVEKYFKKCGIPVRNQKGGNLAKTSAFEAMQELVRGILFYRKSPLKRLLGGLLIGMQQEQMLALEEDIERKGALFEQCRMLQQQLIEQGFTRFYTRFMQSRWQPDGPAVLEHLLQLKEGLQFYSEWQEVADWLMAEEARTRFSAEGLLLFLEECEQRAAEDEAQRSVSSEAEQVALLTMHSSKGLEFEYVFALGLLKRTRAPNLYVAAEEQHAQRRLPLADESDPRYLKQCEEVDAEKMRQLYVVLTRAKRRVYIPVALAEEPQDPPSYGTASPIDLLLAKLSAPAESYSELYRGIAAQNGQALEKLLCSDSQADISQRFLEAQTAPPLFKAQQQALDVALMRPPMRAFTPPSALFIQSYSSLLSSGEETHEAWSTQAAPHDFFALDKSPHTLPSGAETGVLLHKILEAIPFAALKSAAAPSELHPLIAPFVRAGRYAAWQEPIAAMLFHTLKTPLTDGENTFALADVHPKKIYREADFLYACPSQSLFEGIALRPGFLKGVIDLVFEHGGKYYLLDWKSNWLGPSAEYYQPHHLEEAMRLHGYFMQAQIYQEALKRYLGCFDQRPFSELFGGTFYLFMRGVGPGTGIFYSIKLFSQ
jgi:exodeoxyribonuclease V beta subunit